MRIPTRSEVVSTLKTSGQRICAVSPIVYPRALLRAHGLVPIEMWGPPGIGAGPGDCHAQAYICSIARSIVSFVLSGQADCADVMVMPHACDSLQGAAGILQNHARPGMPVVPIYLPRTTGPESLAFLEEEFRSVSRRLSSISGVEPSDQALWDAIQLEEQADGLMQVLLDNYLPVSSDSMEVYRLLRTREYLPAEEFVALAGSMQMEKRSGFDRESAAGIPVVISGIVPEPMELLAALNQAGARVVADDMAAVSRRCGGAGIGRDPWHRMAQWYTSLPPDPMRGSPVTQRMERLRELCRLTGARGVVFWVVKYCEQEMFDVPIITRALREVDIKTLVIEVDIVQPLSMQIRTRIDAFCEILS